MSEGDAPSHIVRDVPLAQRKVLADIVTGLRERPVEQVVRRRDSEHVRSESYQVGVRESRFEVAAYAEHVAEGDPFRTPVSVQFGQIMEPRGLVDGEQDSFAVAGPEQAERFPCGGRRTDTIQSHFVVEDDKGESVGLRPQRFDLVPAHARTVCRVLLAPDPTRQKLDRIVAGTADGQE